MTSQIKKGKRYLVNGYWTLVSTASALLISLQPIMADTIWDRFSKIMRDVYGQLAGISTIVAVTAAAVALLVRMISRNQRAVDEATSWLKRIVVTWIVLNSLGFIVAYYVPDQSKTSDVSVTVPKYEEVSVSVPVYSGNTITGTRTETYYTQNGEETLSPTKKTVTYLECTIHSFDESIIAKAFGLDLSAKYGGTSQTYDQVIKSMANALKMTLYGSVIFQYEELHRNEENDYGKIYSMLQTAEQNARAYFMQCGNSIIQPKDPDEATAEILYMYFNRRSCVDEPFSSRVNRVVVDTMAAKKKVIGVDPVPPIKISHFITPRGIDLTHYNYIIMDGL